MVMAKDTSMHKAVQCQVPEDGLLVTSAPRVMGAQDTALAGSLQEIPTAGHILTGHMQVDLHFGRIAQICRFPTDLHVFWFAGYFPEPRDLGFP